MADNPNNYTPEYVDLDDVPISGPGSDPNENNSTSDTSNVLNPTEVTSNAQYTDVEKRKALFYAETRLEADVNDGRTIQDVTNMHKAAVMNLATHVLTHAGEDPASVSLGDITDSGSAINDYASRYLEDYESMVELIRESDAESGGNNNNRTYTAT